MLIARTFKYLVVGLLIGFVGYRTFGIIPRYELFSSEFFFLGVIAVLILAIAGLFLYRGLQILITKESPSPQSGSS
ncbi:MAG: hypothetical protein A2808_01765 [Candidatus Moranbacteria bacterium RIFCSPHIGHO2_01_FULL_55_24]|nr:MAG: hypothetical protein A2808_01765 [Candidatus Moranbacteria bacterium RIFCSPHIGHO2_01_FULL_55_24]